MRSWQGPPQLGIDERKQLCCVRPVFLIADNAPEILSRVGGLQHFFVFRPGPRPLFRERPCSVVSLARESSLPKRCFLGRWRSAHSRISGSGGSIQSLCQCPFEPHLYCSHVHEARCCAVRLLPQRLGIGRQLWVESSPSEKIEIRSVQDEADRLLPARSGHYRQAAHRCRRNVLIGQRRQLAVGFHLQDALALGGSPGVYLGDDRLVFGLLLQ